MVEEDGTTMYGNGDIALRDIIYGAAGEITTLYSGLPIDREFTRFERAS